MIAEQVDTVTLTHQLRAVVRSSSNELEVLRAQIARTITYAELESAFVEYGLETGGVGDSNRLLADMREKAEKLERSIARASLLADYLSFESRCAIYDARIDELESEIAKANAKIDKDAEADLFVRWRDGELYHVYGSESGFFNAATQKYDNRISPPPNPGDERVRVREELGALRKPLLLQLDFIQFPHSFFVGEHPLFAAIYAARKTSTNEPRT